MFLLSCFGCSRDVGFFCDGDGDFHPDCMVVTDGPLPEATKKMKAAAIVKESDGDRVYDYDGIAWLLDESGYKL